MNAFTKLVSGRLKAQADTPHPDAGMLAAFAENALPDQERRQLLQHLGDCPECREIVFLATPQPAEIQQVLSFPGPRFRFAMRYAGLAASLVVAGALFFYFLNKPMGREASLASAPKTESPKIAQEKAPAELDKMRSDENATANNRVEGYVSNQPKRLPPLKHATGKPQATLSFEDSDEVRVSPRGDSDQKDKKAIAQKLPLQARNTTGVVGLAQSAAASPAPVPRAGMDKLEHGYAYNAPDLAKASVFAGNLGGVVTDRSGAAVANAKVTSLGPAGSKTSTSDSNGRFAFDPLTPGLYSLKVQASGFKSAEVKQVAVGNRPSNLQLTLDVGTSSETVEVSAAAVPVWAPVVSNTFGNSVDEVTANRAQAELTVSRKKGSGSSQAIGAAIGGLMPQWTLSPQGAVQRSLDGGKTWQAVSVVPNAAFLALSAVGSDLWAGGRSGLLLHSSDAGVTWAPVQPTAAGQKLSADIARIVFTDSFHGTVNTANGETWMTSDGGKSWARQ